MNNSILKSINDLDEKEFQDFCNSMLFELFGARVRIGGTGKDRGRDSVYEGELRIPNTSNPPTGKWCFQCKFHNLEKYSWKEKSRLIITDLRNEYKKLSKMENQPFDSYLFMTNVELTWAKGGSFDRIDNTIKPLFYEIGFKNILIWDGVQISGMFAHIPDTIRWFLQIGESKGENLRLTLPKTGKGIKVANLISKQFSRTFEPNMNPNPHVKYLISWKYNNHIFYLVTISSFYALQSLIEMVELLTSNETICVHGSKKYLDRLYNRVKFLPIPSAITEREILDRLLNFEEYMVQ